MGWEAVFTIAVVAAVVFALVRNMAGPDLVLVGGLCLLLAAGVVTPAQGFAGFANEGVLAVAVLLVVAAGVRETGGLDLLASRLLGAPRTLGGALLRMVFPVAGLSMFMGNTAVVAMGVTVVQDWARRLGRSPSRLLLPLSYAAILGGMCTLVGTSTNLLVAGMYAARAPERAMGLFDVATLGLPALVAGVVYMLAVSRWRPPDRGTASLNVASPREYSVVMRVEPGSVVVGKSVEHAGLRHLPGLYLAEIDRGGMTLPAAAPQTVILAGDHLVFVGIVESVADLQRIPGLVPAEDDAPGLSGASPERCLVEAVVSGSSPLVGRTVRASGFRTQYDAVILAVHRHGERVQKKVGDIELEPGDALLLEAHPGWAQANRYDGSFLLISEVEGGKRPRRERAGVALFLLAAMVAVVAAGLLPLLTASLLTAAGMLFAGCLTGPEARRALDVRLILAIGAAFGIGAGIQQSGLAGLLAGSLGSVADHLGILGLLAAVYLVTALLTELVTNAAAAALVFPVAATAAEAEGLPLLPFALLVMVAASASFATPIGYQTNLMVYGPGGYRFGDYLRYGVPLQLVVGTLTVTLVWALWI